MSATDRKRTSRGARKAAPGRRFWALLLPVLPTLVLLPLVWISTFWYLPTRIRLELVTSRLAFTLGGQDRREILNRSVPFSSLVVEDFESVSFAAEKLEVADPRQLVSGANAGEASHFPFAAWADLKLTTPVKFLGKDPGAKLTLLDPGTPSAGLGVLDRIHIVPGSQVVLEVLSGREPALSLEIGTPQNLSLSIGTKLEMVTDLLRPEGIAVPFPDDLLTYRVRFSEAKRTIKVKSGQLGLVLIVTPVPEQTAEIFREPLNLPISALELLEEDLEGTIISPLRDKTNLSYPNYPAVPTETLGSEEAIGLSGLSQARLMSLDFDSGKGALEMRFDGFVEGVASRSGSFTRDHRLTLFHIFRYSWRWTLIAVVAAWLVSTSWAGIEVWKKLHE